MKKIELYIHIPFCKQKCGYCDFLSFPRGEEIQSQYVEALLAEIKKVEPLLEYEVSSVFFGGGTPSILKAEYLTEILDTLRDRFHFDGNAEISLEANPGTVDEEKLKAYRKAGFNRISFGCQATEDELLKKLGRIHTYDQFLKEYEAARKAGFQNINVDLMSALPGQTLKQWVDALKKIAHLGAEHISAYSLILEEGTSFYEKQDELQLPGEEEERRMYEATFEVLGQFGYEQYEISNYAKPGFACRHNVGYWIRTDYLGLGLGAASLLDNKRFSNTDNLEIYLKHSQNPDEIRENVEMLDTKDCQEEFLMLGLRMMRGVSEKEFEEKFGHTLDEIYGDVIDKYVKMGMLVRADGRMFFSRKGISVSNVILADFL